MCQLTTGGNPSFSKFCPLCYPRANIYHGCVTFCIYNFFVTERRIFFMVFLWFLNTQSKTPIYRKVFCWIMNLELYGYAVVFPISCFVIQRLPPGDARFNPLDHLLIHFSVLLISSFFTTNSLRPGLIYVMYSISTREIMKYVKIICEG